MAPSGSATGADDARAARTGPFTTGGKGGLPRGTSSLCR